MEQNEQNEQKPNAEENNQQRKEIFKLYSIIEKPGDQKNMWLDIGVGRRNRDGSIGCKLDCLPLNGIVQLRHYEPKQKKHSFNTNNNLSQNTWQEGGF